MKIVVFGATGGVGRHVVNQALEEGHAVTACSRKPVTGISSRKGLRIVTGDVLDLDYALNAIRGTDAVICALGMPLFNKDGLREKGTRNIVSAMQKLGVKRLICLSAFGTAESRKALPWHYRFVIIPLFMARTFKDHEAQERIIRDSGLDWTIARPSNFTDGPRTGNYVTGLAETVKFEKLNISRADVAEFLVKQLSATNWVRKAPVLSN